MLRLRYANVFYLLCSRCCDTPFASRAMLVRHRCSKHGETKTHVCTNCGKAFTLNADLKRHQRRETRDLKEVCTVCGLKKETKREMPTPAKGGTDATSVTKPTNSKTV